MTKKSHAAYNNSPAGRLRNYRARSKLKAIEWALTNEQAFELFEMPCQYCGGSGFGIDRVDNLIGYLPGNVVPCCSFCNWMKNTMPVEQFFQQAKKIAMHQERLKLFTNVSV